MATNLIIHNGLLMINYEALAIEVVTMKKNVILNNYY